MPSTSTTTSLKPTTLKNWCRLESSCHFEKSEIVEKNGCDEGMVQVANGKLDLKMLVLYVVINGNYHWKWFSEMDPDISTVISLQILPLNHSPDRSDGRQVLGSSWILWWPHGTKCHVLQLCSRSNTRCCSAIRFYKLVFISSAQLRYANPTAQLRHIGTNSSQPTVQVFSVHQVFGIPTSSRENHQLTCIG